MADVKVLVAERSGAELDAVEESNQTTDVILAKGLKTSATDLTFEDGNNGSVTLSDLVNSDDEKVAVSADDTTPGYLLDKVTAGTGVTLVEVSPGGDEDLRIDVDQLVFDDLTDVDTTTTAPSTNDTLIFNGTNWVPVAPGGTGIGAWAYNGAVTQVNNNDTHSASWGERRSRHGIITLRNGEIIGFAVAYDEVISAGQIECFVTLNTVSQNGAGEVITLDSGTPTSDSLEFSSPIAYTAGDRIGAFFDSDNSLSPSKAAMTVTIYTRDT